MNIIFKNLFIVFLSHFLFSGCSLNEVAKKTKDGVDSSKSFISEKSKEVYRKGKEKLGLSNNDKAKVKPMTVAKSPFGVMPNGEKVSQYVLTNANKVQVTLIDYGATVKDIFVPDRNGVFSNISLGFSNLDD